MKRHQVKEIWIKNRKRGSMIEFYRWGLGIDSSRTKCYQIEDITRSSLKRIQTLVQTAHKSRIYLGQFSQQQVYTFHPQKK